MEVPEINVMAVIEWQFFGTLTFKSERLSPERRLKMWFALNRTLASWYHIHFTKLLWVLRIEQGEATGRTHFHCLIGGLPSAAAAGGITIQRQGGDFDVTNRTCHALEAKWGRMGLHESDKQNRISRFSLYDSRLNGASYITKCLGVESGRFCKDVYESAKFGLGDNQLILSDSISAVVKEVRGLSACSATASRRRRFAECGR